MKLNDKEKEEAKEALQNPDPDRQKREFMDSEQKEAGKKNSDKEKKSSEKE